jgi:NAD kinase
VYVEENDFENELFKADEKIRSAMVPSAANEKPSLRKFCKLAPFYECKCAHTPARADVNKIDLIVCIGGDGTLLHVSNLFQVNLQ